MALNSKHTIEYVFSTQAECDETLPSVITSFSERVDATVAHDDATRTVIVTIEHGDFTKVNGVWVRQE